MTGNYPVPSKRYAIFQSAFEKRVAEIQKEVEALDSLQGIYTAAREALIAVNLDNATKLELGNKYVYILINVKDGDTMDIFHPLLDEIGNALVQRKLHIDGLPSDASWNQTDKQFEWKCRNPADPYTYRSLILELSVPWEGTDHIEILKEEKHVERTETTRRAVWHSRPWRPTHRSAPNN